jgi:hypothetical protein
MELGWLERGERQRRLGTFVKLVVYSHICHGVESWRVSAGAARLRSELPGSNQAVSAPSRVDFRGGVLRSASPSDGGPILTGALVRLAWNLVWDSLT